MEKKLSILKNRSVVKFTGKDVDFFLNNIFLEVLRYIFIPFEKLCKFIINFILEICLAKIILNAIDEDIKKSKGLPNQHYVSEKIFSLEREMPISISI